MSEAAEVFSRKLRQLTSLREPLARSFARHVKILRIYLLRIALCLNYLARG